MKSSFIILCVILVTTGLVFSQNNIELKTKQQKTGYTIGFSFGSQIARQPIGLDSASILAGLIDALAKRPSAMPDSVMRSVYNEFVTEVQSAEATKQQQALQTNKTEGEKFLTENSKKDSVKVTASGLQYKIIREGTGIKPGINDTVVVHYRGTLLDGTEFDNSYKRGEPITFTPTGVIKGWTEALQLMKVGSKWQLFIPSDLAYGDRGSGPIEPGKTLLFDVELLDVHKAVAKPAAPDSKSAPKKGTKPVKK